MAGFTHLKNILFQKEFVQLYQNFTATIYGHTKMEFRKMQGKAQPEELPLSVEVDSLCFDKEL